MKLFVRILVGFFLALIVYANVWQRVQVLRLGYRISEMEQRKEGLTKEHRNLWLALCRLKSVERVKSLLKAESSMVEPEKVQIIEVVSK